MKGRFYGKKITIGGRTFEQGKVYDDPRFNAFGKAPNVSGSKENSAENLKIRHTNKRS